MPDDRGHQRRSISSRFYRWTCRERVHRTALALVVIGWSTAGATLIATGQETPDPYSRVVTLASVLLASGAMVTMGLMLGVSKLVAMPAAREAAARAMDAHLGNGNPHPGYVSRDEHRQLVDRLDENNEKLERLLGRLEGK